MDVLVNSLQCNYPNSVPKESRERSRNLNPVSMSSILTRIAAWAV